MLLQDASAHRLGGMRGYDRLDREPFEHARERSGSGPGAREPGEKMSERAGLRFVRRLERIVLPSPDAMVLLGDVRELEVDGEGADDADGLLPIEAPQERQKLARGSGPAPIRTIQTAAKGFRKPTDELLGFEKLSPSVPHHAIAEDLSKHPHVGPQREVLLGHRAPLEHGLRSPTKKLDEADVAQKFDGARVVTNDLES